MNDFLGQLCLEGHEPVMLSRDNMLLRGCQLRNTDWVWGLVLATGTDTKITFTGSGDAAKVKVGHTMQMVNVDILFVCVWLVAICVAGACANAAMRAQYTKGQARLALRLELQPSGSAAASAPDAFGRRIGAAVVPPLRRHWDALA